MKIIKNLVALLLAVTTFTASASFISGLHQLSNGNQVDLQGLQWMPLIHTANISRLDIEDGFTDNFGTSWQKGDWRYATRAETEKLMYSLWDGTYNGLSSGNASGAWWFLETFGGLAFDTGYGPTRVNGTDSDGGNFDASYFIYGSYADNYGLDVSRLGFIGAETRYFGHIQGYNVHTKIYESSRSGTAADVGWIFVDHCGVFNAGCEYFVDFTSFESDWGSLLVRDLPVVIPVTAPGSSTLWVLAGAIFVVLRRRKNADSVG